MIPGPTGGIKIGKGKKNPLDAWEIEGRAFSAQMLPPGQIGFRFLLLPDRDPDWIHALPERHEEAQIGQGIVLFRSSVAIGNRFFRNSEIFLYQDLPMNQ